MPDTITPNYSLLKPEVMGSVDTWGGKLNTNFDILDTEIKQNEDTGANSLKKEHADVLERTAKGYLFYDSALAGNAYDQGPDCLLSNKAVRGLLNLMLPVGTVIMWAGNAGAVPWGWALCNGQIANGQQTPNLTDRFVLAGGGSWAVGAVGGTAGLNHSARVSGTALDANTMPAHYHTVQPHQHAHNTNWVRAAGYSLVIGNAGGLTNDPARFVSNGLDTGMSTTGIANTDWAGASWAHDHAYSFSLPWYSYWPQFYALAFIMRVVSF